MDKISNSYMISIVGGGGKTTICQFLSDFFYKSNEKILLTTTTKIYFHPMGNTYIGPIENIPLRIGIITAGKKLMESDNKIIGYDPDELDSLYDLNLFDYIIVEADGAKKRPIKAPCEYEPVIPNNTNLVIGVIGLDSYNKTINEENVFRSEIFKKITGGENSQINVSHYIKLIEDKNGLFKGCPPHGEKLVIFNKSDALESTDLNQIIIEAKKNQFKTVITCFKN